MRLISDAKKWDVCPPHNASVQFCFASDTPPWLALQKPEERGERHPPSMWEMGMLTSSASCRVTEACRALASWTKSDALSVYE